MLSSLIACLVGHPGDATLRKVQVKTVRSQPWYVRLADFEEFSEADNGVCAAWP
jgi:hypothetical protein